MASVRNETQETVVQSDTGCKSLDNADETRLAATKAANPVPSEKQEEVALPSWNELDDQERVRLKKAYVFLLNSTFSLLRLIARKWNIVQTGATQNRILVARIFNFILENVREDAHTVNEILTADHSWGYVQFLVDWNPELDKTPNPDLEMLRKDGALKPKYGSKKTNSKASNGNKSGSRKCKAVSSPKKKGNPKGKRKKRDVFNASEFKRILLIFKHYQEVRDRFCQSLGKVELDNGVKSKDFWEDHVAKIYNDPTFRPRFSAPPALKGINPSKTPTIQRDGAFLETTLRTFQPIFGELEAGFRVSSQNCPDFETYLTEVRKVDVLSGVGQLLLVAGEMVNIGSKDHEDQDLIDILSRKSTVLGHEGGLEKKLPSFLISEEKSPGNRNKKRNSLEQASGACLNLCNSFQKTIECSSGQPEWDYSDEQQNLLNI